MKVRIIVEHIYGDNEQYLLRDHPNSICFVETKYRGKDQLARSCGNLAPLMEQEIASLRDLPEIFFTDEELKELREAEAATSAQQEYKALDLSQEITEPNDGVPTHE